MAEKKGVKKKTKKKPTDINALAAAIVKDAMDENSFLQKPTVKEPMLAEGTTRLIEKPTDKNPAAVALGRLGGKKGGPARAAKLTPKQRKQIAKKAALARWSKKKS